MSEQQTAYERLMRWCQGIAATEQQTIVPGKRTILRLPTAEPDKRREGRIDHDDFRQHVWKGGTVGEVVDQMNEALGKVDDSWYEVTE